MERSVSFLIGDMNILIENRQQDNASDADSDLEELEGDIAKLDETVRTFLADQRGENDASPAARGLPRGKGARGPRKAAKPRGDITARLSKVNQAFLSGDYPLALDLAVIGLYHIRNHHLQAIHAHHH